MENERLGRFVARRWGWELLGALLVVLAVYFVLSRIDQLDTRLALLASWSAVIGALAVIAGGLMVEQFRIEEARRQSDEDDRVRRLVRFEQLQWDALYQLDEWLLASMELALISYPIRLRGDPLPTESEQSFREFDQRGLVLVNRLDNREIEVAMTFYNAFISALRRSDFSVPGGIDYLQFLATFALGVINASKKLRRQLSGRDDGTISGTAVQDLLDLLAQAGQQAPDLENFSTSAAS